MDSNTFEKIKKINRVNLVNIVNIVNKISINIRSRKYFVKYD